MNIQAELKRIDALRAELLKGVVQGDGIKALEKAQTVIKPGSKDHEALLSTGYGMDKAEAGFIIKDVDTNGGNSRYPYKLYKKAQAFLEAFKAKPVVISTKPAWRTRHHARITEA
jgi:hypothetical protein